MKLRIVTPERLVYESENVEAVYGKAVDGHLGILPKHVPLITPLEIGVLTYVEEGKHRPLAVMGGMLSTDGQTVTILSDAAELSSDIDTARAQQAKERAESRLREREANYDLARVEKSLARALVRLKVTGGSR